MFQFIKKNIFEDLLITQKQVYRYVKSVEGNKLWMCYKITCPAKLYTSGGKVVLRMGLHTHDVPTGYIQKKMKEGKIFKEKLT